MSVVEVRALKALYRNHPATPPNMRYSSATKRVAFANRDMLLAWAATQPDDALLDCRNLGTSSLAWIREQTGDPKSPFADLEDENAALRSRIEELESAARPILDRCLDFFGDDDLDPESSEAMPVVIKNRWVYALRAAMKEAKAYREDTDA